MKEKINSFYKYTIVYVFYVYFVFVIRQKENINMWNDLFLPLILLVISIIYKPIIEKLSENIGNKKIYYFETIQYLNYIENLFLGTVIFWSSALVCCSDVEAIKIKLISEKDRKMINHSTIFLSNSKGETSESYTFTRRNCIEFNKITLPPKSAVVSDILYIAPENIIQKFIFETAPTNISFKKVELKTFKLSISYWKTFLSKAMALIIIILFALCLIWNLKGNDFISNIYFVEAILMFALSLITATCLEIFLYNVPYEVEKYFKSNFHNNVYDTEKYKLTKLSLARLAKK